MNLHKNSIISVIGAVLITTTGCASKVWYQSGKSPEEIRRTLAKCRMEANRVGTGMGGWNAGSFAAAAMMDGGRKKEFIRECMISEGYKLIKKSELPAGEVGVED